MPGAILGSVRVTPESALPAEPVLVEALGPDGSALDPAIPVAINGIRGARQFLQFPNAGTFDVHVVAEQEGTLDAEAASVQVQAPDWPDVAAPPDGLPVSIPNGLRRLPLLSSARPPGDPSPYRVQLSAIDTDHFVGNLARTYEPEIAAGAAVPMALDDALAVTKYSWDFGDGTTATTTLPTADHDYFGSLAPDKEHHLFDVSCTLETKSGATFEVKRTMSVVNAYAVCRNRGVVAPPVVGSTHARKSMGTFTGSILVRNVESFPLTLERRRFGYESGANEVVTGWETLVSPLTLPPGTTTAVSVTVPFETIPARTSAFSVVFVGEDPDGRAVHVETVLDVALPDHRSSGIRWGRVALTQIAAGRFDQVAGILAAAQAEHPNGGGGGNDGGPAGPFGHGGIEVEGHHVGLGGVEGHHFGGQVEGHHVGLGGVEGHQVVLGGVEGGVELAPHHHGIDLGAAQAAGGVEVAAGGGAVELNVAAAQQQLAAAVAAAETAGAALMTREISFAPAAGAAGAQTPAFARAASDLASISTDASVGATAGPLAPLLRADRLGSALVEGGEVSAQAVIAALDTADGTIAAGALSSVADAAKRMKLILAGPIEGSPCDPDNRPEGIDDQWACQIKLGADNQPEMMTWHRHARFVNARKGDLLLAPGGPSGIIGGLLRQVDPPQHYAHIGIMTRNYDMVTHSTYSEDRLKAHPVGSVTIPLAGSEPAPTDGYEPEILKFGWPGVITQWVGGAVDTGALADLQNLPNPGDAETERPAVDPDGQTYKLTPFNKYSAIGDDFEIVPPLIVKPSPLEETPEVRAALHALADAALADTGKSHYRFFAYTDPTVGLTPEPPGDRWYSGTYGSVCSSFVWLVARRLGIQLESPGGVAERTQLEPADVAAGAEVRDGSPDGLYLYRADERRAAGAWLHDRLASMVMDELKEKARAKLGSERAARLLGGLIDLFSDIADDVANQMCNAFAWDWTDKEAKDSTRWSEVDDSLAVSPDNTMFWDPPSRGGLYGYAVPAAYAAPAVEQGPKYVWRFVPNRGTLHGTVRFLGQPVGGAMVQVTDGLTAFTHSDGTYRLQNVPFGKYELKAQYDRGDGGPIPGQILLDMSQVDQTADFDLAPPKAWYRNAHVTGEFYFMKEYVIGKNPRTDPPYGFSFDVAVTPDPGGSPARWQVHNDFHGIFGVANFLFLWQNNGVIELKCTYAVAQDASIVEDAANALSSAVDWLSLGYVDTLFGSEVRGSDSADGTVDPNGPAFERSFTIGDSDGTHGSFKFRVENWDL